MFQMHDLNRPRMISFLQGLETKGPFAYEKLCYLLDNLGHGWLCEHLLAELVCERSNITINCNIRKQVELLVRQRLQQRARHLDVRDVNELVSIIATRYQANRITSARQHSSKGDPAPKENGYASDSLEDIVSDVVEQYSVTPKTDFSTGCNQIGGVKHVTDQCTKSQLVESKTVSSNQIKGLRLVTSRRALNETYKHKTKVGEQTAKQLLQPAMSTARHTKPANYVAGLNHVTGKRAVTETDVGKVKVSFKKASEGNHSYKGHEDGKGSRRHKGFKFSPEEEEVFASFVWNPLPINLPETRKMLQKLRQNTFKPTTNTVDVVRQAMVVAESTSPTSQVGADVTDGPDSADNPDHNGLAQMSPKQRKSKNKPARKTAEDSPRGHIGREMDAIGPKIGQLDPDSQRSRYVAKDILRDRDMLYKSINNIDIMKRANCQSDNTMEKGLLKLEEQYWQKRCEIIRRCRSVGYYNFLSEHKRKRCDACAGHPCDNTKDCASCRAENGRKGRATLKKSPGKLAPEATQIVQINDFRLPPGIEPFKPEHAQTVRFVNHQGQSHPSTVTSFDDEKCPGAFCATVSRRRRCLACAYANEQVAGFYDAVVAPTGDHHLYFPSLAGSPH